VIPRVVRTGDRARSASTTFANRIVDRAPHEAWIGLEHEFVLHDERGHRVDFRTVIRGLNLGQAHLNPVDRFAYPLPTGSVCTADQREAEIALPPVTVTSGFARRLDAWAGWERAALARRAPHLVFQGDSTHLSIEIPPDVDADAVALQFAARFALGLMLLMDRRHSPGLLVRPRPGRLELGGEFAVGDALRSAALYAFGATSACVASVRRRDQDGLPPALECLVERNVFRFGWYVSRRAFGGDLYVALRDMPVRTLEGGAALAGTILEQSWSAGRRHLVGIAGPSELAEADELVGGTRDLVLQRPTGDVERDLAPPEMPHSPFGDVLETRHADGFDVAPVMVTWQLVTVLAGRRDGRRSAFAAVPGHLLAGYAAAMNAGSLDEPIRRYLGTGSRVRRLISRDQVREPGLFDAIGLRASLLAPERDIVGNVVELRPAPRPLAETAPRGVATALA
jgi:hypothetical protein